MSVTALMGCSSIRKAAIGTVAGALEDSVGVFASDDDVELVGQALPFALKTIEALLQERPEDDRLLLAACSGFTQYSYAYAELPAFRLVDSDYHEARRQKQRALKLYLRARGYCLRAFDARYPGSSARLAIESSQVLERTRVADVPLLYWTAGSWGSAISLGLERLDLVIDLPAVRALLNRAVELDPDFERGALQEAMVLLEALPETMGGSYQRARDYYERALELNGGQRASTYVTWAERVALPRQDRADFEASLELALAVDVNRAAETDRLVNTISQQKADILLERAGDLFLEDIDGDEP